MKLNQLIVSDIGMTFSGICLGMASTLDKPSWLMPTLFLIGLTIIALSIIIQANAYKTSKHD